jgi:hypothetical protein
MMIFLLPVPPFCVGVQVILKERKEEKWGKTGLKSAIYKLTEFNQAILKKTNR